MTKTELFATINQHLLKDEKPSEYLNTLLSEEIFQNPPYRMLYLLSKTEQLPKYHPEGNAWIHTLMVVDEAAKVRERSTHPDWFMWASFLHDIGKPETTRMRHGRLTSYGHDEVGEHLAKEFLEEFIDDEEEIAYIVGLVRYHMHILYIIKSLPHGMPKAMVKETNIEDVALLGWCDRMGRTNAIASEEEKAIRLFYKKANKLKD